MITVHHLEQSRSQRILWLLEELELPYEIKRYHRDPKTFLAPRELKEIHPLGKSPVIDDAGQLIAESGAIIEYLLEKYDLSHSIKGDNPVKLKYWLHFAEGSLMPFLVQELIFNKIESSTPFFLRPVAAVITKQVKRLYINPNLKTYFDFMEAELSKSTWFVGEHFSAADIQLSFPIEGANPSLLGPHLKNFISSIQKRPAYQRALKKT